MKAIKWIVGLISLYLLSMGVFYVAQQPEALSHPIIRGTFGTVYEWKVDSQSWVKTKIQSFQKRKLGLDKISVPMQEGQLPTGELVKNQWEKGQNRFVYVAYSDANLYSQPREDSLVLRTLKLSERVRVGVLDPNTVSVKGRKTRWAFLLSPDGKIPLGWVLDFQLGYKSRFQPISSWSWDTFEFCKGQYCASYSVTIDGLFDLRWGAQGGRLYLEGQDKGRLLQYGQLYWAKKASYEDVVDVFKVEEGGVLTQEDMYETQPIRIVTF
jgi:hypothetical protein